MIDGVRKAWRRVWKADGADKSERHFCRTDRRLLRRRRFWICAVSMLLGAAVIAAGNACYMKYIPNTAEWCRTQPDGLSEGIYLVCTNTGDLYSLELSEQGPAGEEAVGAVKMTMGSDAVSGADIQVIKYPDRQKGYARISGGSGAVSLRRMKALFCDDCIRGILNAVEGQRIQNAVLYDSGKGDFYPVVAGEELRIGDLVLKISAEEEQIDITIRPGESLKAE